MNGERRGFRYYFKNPVESPADMPKGPERWCIYDEPLYTPQYQRDTCGWVEYDHPLQQCDIDDFHLLVDNRAALRFVMRG
jgi:hypothetical protein